MQTVVMHVDGRGIVWAIAKCKCCGEVHKYPASDILSTNPPCKSCKRPMSIQGAVIAADSKAPPACRPAVLRPGEGIVDAN